MAGSPGLKIYTAEGEYVAACKRFEDAACLVSFLGHGATVRADHAKKYTLWTEGKDGTASESYDKATETMIGRDNAAYFAGVRS